METPLLTDNLTFAQAEDTRSVSANDKVILCFSIFYAKKRQGKLIAEAVVPFLNNHDQIPAFFYLSNERGEHVRLVLNINERESLDIAKTVESYFNDYLSRNPSSQNSNKEKVSVFFMNFENNSIQHGLFDCYPDPWFNLKIGLSKLLVYTFKEYDGDFQSDINEILFQILTIFCNAVKLSNQDIIIVFEPLLENEKSHYKANKIKAVTDLNEENYMDNKNVLFEYIKVYRAIEGNAYDDEWEIEWYGFGRTFFNATLVNASLQKKQNDIAFAINVIMEAFNVKNRFSPYYLFLNVIKQLEKDH